MKKNKIPLCLLILLAPISSVGVAINLDLIYLQSELIIPEGEYCEDITLNYNVIAGPNVDKRVYEKFVFGDNNEITKTTISTRIRSNGVVSKSVSIPTSILLGENGLLIKAYICDATSHETIRHSSVRVHNKSGATIDPTKVKEYTSKTLGFKLDISFLEVKDSYQFTNIDDYFLTDIYYKIPFDQFHFKYNNDFASFTYESASVSLVGNESYFSGLSYKNNEAKLPLNIEIDENGVCSLKLDRVLYVDPKTLHISSSPRAFYVVTNNLYLPVNHIEDLYGMQFVFRLNGLGMDKINLVWTTTLISSSGLIGNCHNSEYCVVGRTKS